MSRGHQVQRRVVDHAAPQRVEQAEAWGRQRRHHRLGYPRWHSCNAVGGGDGRRTERLRVLGCWRRLLCAGRHCAGASRLTHHARWAMGRLLRPRGIAAWGSDGRLDGDWRRRCGRRIATVVAVGGRRVHHGIHAHSSPSFLETKKNHFPHYESLTADWHAAHVHEHVHLWHFSEPMTVMATVTGAQRRVHLKQGSKWCRF